MNFQIWKTLVMTSWAQDGVPKFGVSQNWLNYSPNVPEYGIAFPDDCCKHIHAAQHGSVLKGQCCLLLGMWYCTARHGQLICQFSTTFNWFELAKCNDSLGG